MATTYEYDGNLMCCEDGVLEQFRRIAVGSVRTPVEWLAVELEPRKHDMVRVQDGPAMSADAAFYSSPLNTNATFAFDVPAAEAATVKAYFDGIAAAAGRS